MIDFINSFDPLSVFFGMIFCMVLDILFSIANYYVRKALMIRNCKICNSTKNCQYTDNLC